MDTHPDVTSSVLTGLGWYYLIMCVMNLLWTIRSYKVDGDLPQSVPLVGGFPVASLWAVVTAILLMVSATHFSGTGSPDTFLIRLPAWFKDWFDGTFANPVVFFGISIAGFVAMIVLRGWWTRDTVAWTLLNASVLFMGLSMTDWDFRQIVGKPDNVPIVGMLFILGFLTWIYFRRAVDNDRRVEEGRERPARDAQEVPLRGRKEATPGLAPHQDDEIPHGIRRQLVDVRRPSWRY